MAKIKIVEKIIIALRFKEIMLYSDKVVYAATISYILVIQSHIQEFEPFEVILKLFLSE